jgi:uncharacterized membrane protein YeaQ/YmgE (transglycosylase-associated protein family)
MPLEVFLIWLLIGAISGWLAGIIVEGSGFGLVGNIIVGILGSFVAGYMLPRLGVHLGSGVWGHIANGTIGGIVVLLIMMTIKRA